MSSFLSWTCHPVERLDAQLYPFQIINFMFYAWAGERSWASVCFSKRESCLLSLALPAFLLSEILGGSNSWLLFLLSPLPLFCFLLPKCSYRCFCSHFPLSFGLCPLKNPFPADWGEFREIAEIKVVFNLPSLSKNILLYFSLFWFHLGTIQARCCNVSP